MDADIEAMTSIIPCGQSTVMSKNDAQKKFYKKLFKNKNSAKPNKQPILFIL